jgi:hypothetical protein
MRRLIFVLIIWAITSIPSPSLAERAREGYCKVFTVTPDSNETILVVPDGKRFVLRKLYAIFESLYRWEWQLTVDDVLFMDGRINMRGYQSGVGPDAYSYAFYQGVHDFPDQCVVVNSGETLKAQNLHSQQEVRMTFIGYYENVGSISDLNGDGKVDFTDFAMMASEWLSTV